MRRRHLERFAADGTVFLSQLGVEVPHRRWDALTHVERAPHDGQLYDITIAGSQSFIAGGLAVHNCPTSHNNVHELWRLMVKAGKAGIPIHWQELRRFSEYVRDVVTGGYAQAKEAGQVP